MSTIAFRPLDDGDLALLVEWFNRPHVYEWWGVDAASDGLGGPGDKAATARDVDAKYRRGGTDECAGLHHHVALFDGHPVGFLQWYPTSIDPAYATAIGEPDAVAIDYLIGEPDLTDRGMGPAMIDAYVREVVVAESGATRVVASPSVENPRSVRALEKAGFVFSRDAEVGEPTPERVMVRTLN